MIDFSMFEHVERILRKRVALGGVYLFPSEEVAGKQGGDKPVSRQSVYNVIQKIRTLLGNQLKGVRLGLHSCRKFAIQQVMKLTKDIFKASIWVGHGRGRGNITMTERYLERSQHSCRDVNLRLSKSLKRLLF
ncbi:hypothetical protein JCM19233_6974 [Vibrio astriarenae]|nr:hypothetical protein JCM19233_6974 [Vibrio sp. C7]